VQKYKKESDRKRNNVPIKQCANMPIGCATLTR